MSSDRKVYKRESEEARRDALIAAAMDLVATGGPQAATVRAIADRAGVTPGLIRHYFSSKEELTRAAYRRLMDMLTRDSTAAMLTGDFGPKGRLVAFVSASLRPPVVDPRRLGLWAGFLNALRTDSAMREVHEQGYRAYRDILEMLIAQLPRPDAQPDQIRRDAIACNAVIDGLWLELSLGDAPFSPDDATALAEQWLEALVS